MSGRLQKPSPERGTWKRPKPAASGPDRRFRGYYRAADPPSPDDANAADAGAQPPGGTEAAMLSAMRLAYRLVDEQIACGARWADERVLDQAEHLAMDAGLRSLRWVEALLRGDWASAIAARVKSSVAATSTTALPVRNESPVGERRPVLGFGRVQLPATLAADGHEVEFRRAGSTATPPAPALKGRVARGADGKAELVLTTPSALASGLWVAGLYDAGGLQIGLIEIEL